MSNFDFIKEECPKFYKKGKQAEDWVWSLPEESIKKSGELAESISKEVVRRENLLEWNNHQFDRIKLMQTMGSAKLPEYVCNLLHTVRKSRNFFAHDDEEDDGQDGGYIEKDALEILKDVFGITKWFAKNYCRMAAPVSFFQVPSKELPQDQQAKQNQQDIQQLQAESAENKAETQEQRKRTENLAAENRKLKEKLAENERKSEKHQSDLQKLHAENDVLKKKSANNEAAIAKLDYIVNQLKRDSESEKAIPDSGQKNKILELEAENKNLKAQITANEADSLQHQQALQRLKAENESLKERSSKNETEIGQLPVPKPPIDKLSFMKLPGKSVNSAAAPTLQSVRYQMGRHEVLLSWIQPEGFDACEIWRSNGREKAALLWDEKVLLPRYVDRHLPAQEKCTYKIRCKNTRSGELTGFSNGIQAVVARRAAGVEIAEAHVLADAVQLRWRCIPDALSYTVRRKNSESKRNELTEIVPNTQFRYEDTDVVRGNQYIYQIECETQLHGRMISREIIVTV